MTPERYALIKALFTRAADLSEDRRDEFLTRECGADAELKREVQLLLEHDVSQTIIAADDTTVADLAARTVADSAETSLRKGVRGWGRLTKHLGPRGHLAIGGLVAGLILAFLGFVGYHGVYQFQKELRREALNEIVDGKVMALEMWLEHEQSKIASWARSNDLRRQVGQLVDLANESEGLQGRLAQSQLQDQIGAELNSLAGREVEFSIWDWRHQLIADTLSELDRIGQTPTPRGAAVLTSVLEGIPRVFALDDKNTVSKFDASTSYEPHVGIISPIRGDDGDVIAALLVHSFESRDSVSRILRMIQLGHSGETYVFNRDGLMLSESRFDEQLRELGLIANQPSSRSARVVHVRDPGGDLAAGFVPEEPLEARPLTKMARLCIAGRDGDDLDGYRDYRGVMVVGAWRWLEDLDVGVATELDVDEAEPGLQILIWGTWLILGLFASCMGIALFSYYSVDRMRRHMGEDRKLGQYVLEQQIGEGGMGKVFKARHEFLKRPTAVKLLKPELGDPASIARFEREAQLASMLEHPNTVRIYDYGVTPEGLFYYVMEYIDGLCLDNMIKHEATIPPARTIFLLRQICYSLCEAHDAGLVHRDLKPSNIMVCNRGGEFDVVKVLDFGLVKPIETSQSEQITSTNLVAGTPQYIAPERLSDTQTNDPRSDIYSLGAVVFFLLTGRDFIQGGSLPEVLLRVLTHASIRPSDCTDQQIPPALDDLVYRCLAQDPDGRPASVRDILKTLEDIELADPWTRPQAESWWREKQMGTVTANVLDHPADHQRDSN